MKEVIDPAKMPQQELLRAAIAQMDGISRVKFAERIGATKRALDNWMLPDGSEGRRPMPVMARKFICVLLAHPEACPTSDAVVIVREKKTRKPAKKRATKAGTKAASKPATKAPAKSAGKSASKTAEKAAAKPAPKASGKR